MKEDVLEQLVEDWLVSQTGWFVKHNVKYRPAADFPGYDSKKDSVHSDIDIVAYSPTKKGRDRVSVVTCKSWQGGVKVSRWLESLESEATYNIPSIEFQKRERWKSFREIVSEKWLVAFLNKIEQETGQRSFTYYIAVTKISGKDSDSCRKLLENSEIIDNRFKKHGSNIAIKLLPLQEIIESIQARMNSKDTPVLETTSVGRLLQLLQAAGIENA